MSDSPPDTEHPSGDADSVDITSLILDDHNTFRRAFAALDDLQGPDVDSAGLEQRLAEVWQPLADLLDVHAVAEEQIFYPALLRKGDEGVPETVDAIGDHNDIRDPVREAAQYRVGSTEWWDAVNRARAANTHHMGEEEDEALADFRRNSTRAQRADLGRRFAEFKATHTVDDLDTSDQDPQRYVAEHLPGPPDVSLRIGSLR
ncbi:hemerythrin domain-containing protein [Sporichthya polymorpha]|uniref:hemerythrin domain-containing protein n=1 Tax=Sporichthya polymorpha TaxID=35751 RepID=UPI00035CA941|nr:hemerythrin domain-containing protein [Sporichthya polymorpha]